MTRLKLSRDKCSARLLNTNKTHLPTYRRPRESLNMAILPGLPGLQVTIQSDRKDLPEYLDEGDWSQKKYAHLPKGKRTTSFVEVVDNTEFSVALEFEPSFKFDTESISVL